jgi:hypothetical protein
LYSRAFGTLQFFFFDILNILGAISLENTIEPTRYPFFFYSPFPTLTYVVPAKKRAIGHSRCKDFKGQSKSWSHPPTQAIKSLVLGRRQISRDVEYQCIFHRSPCHNPPTNKLL